MDWHGSSYILCSELKEKTALDGGKVLRTGHLIFLTYPIWQSVFGQAISLFMENYKGVKMKRVENSFTSNGWRLGILLACHMVGAHCIPSFCAFHESLSLCNLPL